MSALKGIDLINAIEQQKYDVLVLNTDDKADDYNSCDEDNWAMSAEVLRLAKIGCQVETALQDKEFAELMKRVDKPGKTLLFSDLNRLVGLAEFGQSMQWIDGTPPAFGPDERKWVIIEYLTPFLKTKAYLTVYWNGVSYCDKKVQFAIKWMPLPEPPVGADNG